MLSFSSDKYPEVNLLDHMVVQFLTFWGVSILFFKVATSNTFYFGMISDLQKSDYKEIQRLFVYPASPVIDIYHNCVIIFILSFSVSLCVCVYRTLLFAYKFFYFWTHYTSCGILVPQPGVKSTPPAKEAWNF